MIIQNISTANEPFIQSSPNPQFFGSTTEHGAGGKNFWVTPAPISQVVTVTPPSVMQNGVIVNFPPYSDVIEMQAPAKQVFIPGNADVVKNAYESVGLINEGGQIRLCALVRPAIIAAAHHYNGGPGGWAQYIGMSVRFIGSAGTQTARIVKVVFTADDLECYQLDQAITVVAPAVIAPLEADPAYMNRQCVIFGLANLSKPIAGIVALKYSFASGATRTAQASNKSNSTVQVQAGDSGSPTFIFVAGVPRFFGSMAAVNLGIIVINVASPWINQIGAL